MIRGCGKQPASIIVSSPADESDRVQDSNKEECLLPLVDFRVDAGNQNIINEDVPFPDDWEVAFQFPEEFSEEGVSLLFARSVNGQNEIWFLSHSPKIQLLIYKLDGGEWNILANPDLGIPDWPIHSFYLDPFTGDVWVYKGKSSLKSFNLRQGNSASLIAKFHDDLESFEIVDFPFQESVVDLTTSRIQDLQVDEEGNLWFLLDNDLDSPSVSSLFEVDLASTQLIKHEELTGYSITSFFIRNNQEFIISGWNLGESDSEKPFYILLIVDKESNERTEYQLPRSLDFTDTESHSSHPVVFFSEFADVLWVGKHAYFDLHELKWYGVVESSVFYDVLPGAGFWIWGTPEFISETQNGLIWFNSLRGSGWVNVADEKWCIITTNEIAGIVQLENDQLFALSKLNDDSWVVLDK